MPDIHRNQTLTSEERVHYIESLNRILPVLRTAAGISQEELANSIGISRQTLSSIESGKRKMTWPTYLSLVLFFLSNQRTQQMFSESEAYPQKILGGFNKSFSPKGYLRDDIPEDFAKMVSALDEQGVHTLKTTLMLEYARCTKQSGEAVLKAFDGRNYSPDILDPDLRRAQIALRNIRRDENG